jgi:hypothetical protein
MEKKEKAFLLFKTGTTHIDIADILGVSANTIGKWSSKGEWAKKLISMKTDEQSRTEITMKLMMYQLKSLEKMVDDFVADEQYVPLEGKYADGILKLYNTIKTEAVTYEVTIKVIKRLLVFCAAHDLETAKKLEGITKAFLAEEKENV